MYKRQPLVGSFVKGADVIPKLVNKFNPKFILSSTVGGDAKYSGFLNNFISVQDYEEELNCLVFSVGLSILIELKPIFSNVSVALLGQIIGISFLNISNVGT